MFNGLELDAGELMLMVAGEFSMVGGKIKGGSQTLSNQTLTISRGGRVVTVKTAGTEKY
jgi:hypothetical protein